jgi:hypothetical protein
MWYFWDIGMTYQYPIWTTPSNLGTFAQDYSFDLNPIQIVFGANSGTVVSLLNGELPLGLKYIQINDTINIYGTAIESIDAIDSQFTFRAIQVNGGIADRTFYLNLTPLIVSPSWENQNTFLGYQSNISVVSYLLTATSISGDHLIYDLPLQPDNALINSRTGLFTLNAFPFTSNLTVSTLVRATDSVTGGDSNITVQVDVVTSPGPNWVTTPGSLGVFYSGDFVEINLLAEDPFASSITYVLAEPEVTEVGWGIIWDDAFGWDNNVYTTLTLTLAPDGLLYGQLPSVLVNTTYNFKVTATSVNGSSTAIFSLTNEPAINNSEFYWNTIITDLGVFNEGQYISIPIKATTARGTVVVYNVTGGLLPPHLILGSTNGIIEGFVEYTAIDKTYYFDITANDGHQTIIQQFSITVNKIYSNQFFNAYIPLTGILRDQWDADTADIHVREPGTITVDSMINLPEPPAMNIINGLITGYSTPDQIFGVIAPWWHELSLQIGPASNSNVSSTGLSTIYRNVVDFQFGSNAVISDSYVQGNNVYPISIDNIRNALIANYPYVLGGSGQGFAMLPNLNWSTGGIESVTVLDTGYNYLSPPDIVVSGSGSGAQLQAILGLVGTSVVSAGSNWSIGDTVTIQSGDALVLAEVTVTNVNSIGGLVSLEITLAGNYRNVGKAENISITLGDAIASINVVWGIVAVDVISSGQNYQCGISINTVGGEILPKWQMSYSPVIEVGEISSSTAQLAAAALNIGSDPLLGTLWNPNFMVMQWQGITWIGSTTFDESITTFDGNTTQFQDTESPLITVFDNNTEIFDQGTTIFDFQDPLAYDLYQVWGSTLIDAGTTVFDLYSTIFDSLPPRRYSNTRLQKWINTQNKIYSGNNAVW